MTRGMGPEESSGQRLISVASNTPAVLLLAVLLLLPSPVLAADTGWASTWSGPAATNDCHYPWTACTPRRVTSLDTGRSIVVIPSQFCVCHVDGVAHSDRLIDLGPGAGHDGGRVVFEGTPADLVAARSTLTGEHLATYVGAA